MNGWISKTCMIILLKILIKKYNFKNKQYLARRKLQLEMKSLMILEMSFFVDPSTLSDALALVRIGVTFYERGSSLKDNNLRSISSWTLYLKPLQFSMVCPGDPA
jgi:hypothetical protein